MAVVLMPLVFLRDYLPSGELHFLSIADEALQEGRMFAFTYRGEPCVDAAPLYLWCVMLGRQLLGYHAIWFLSLFSFLPAVIVFAIMERWTRPVLDAGTRFSAMLMLASSGLYLGLALFLGMDMLLVMFITLAMYFFWRLYKGIGSVRLNKLGFALAIFFGILTKGPAGLLIPLAATLVFLLFKGRMNTMTRYWGRWTLVVLVLGGAFCMWRVWVEGGAEYVGHLASAYTTDSFVDLLRHEEPVWFYFKILFFTLAPWSLLLIGLIVAALLRSRRLEDIEQLFLTFIFTTLVLLSAFNLKSVLYIAPVLPFVVYLAALVSRSIPTNGWMKLAVAIPAFFWAASLPAVMMLMRFSGFQYLDNYYSLTAGISLFVSGVATVIALWRRAELHVPIDLLSGGLMVALFVGGFALPEINDEVGHSRLTRHTREILDRGDADRKCYAWHIPYAASLEVLLDDRHIESVESEEIISGHCAGGILLLPEFDLHDDALLHDHLAEQHHRHRVGRYLIIEMDE